MKKKKLEIGFKGKRQYIHGTDIINKFMEYVCSFEENPILDVEITFHKMSNRNLIIHAMDMEKINDFSIKSEDVVRISYSSLEEKKLFILKEADDSSTFRLPYDEKKVTEFCSVSKEEKIINLRSNSSGYTPIEIIVPMNKLLLQNTVSKPENRDWVFCRWESPHWPLPDDFSNLTLRLKENFGFRLTKSVVTDSDKFLGNIYFSAKES